MAVSESEATERWRALVDIANAAGFDWVIAQVEQAITDGVEIARDVSAAEVSTDVVSRAVAYEASPTQRRRGASRMLGSRPYKESEKLLMLVNALKAVTGQRLAMEQQVSSLATRVAFLPELEFTASGSPEHTLDGAAGGGRREAVRNSVSLLDEFLGDF